MQKIVWLTKLWFCSMIDEFLAYLGLCNFWIINTQFGVLFQQMFSHINCGRLSEKIDQIIVNNFKNYCITLYRRCSF